MKGKLVRWEGKGTVEQPYRKVVEERRDYNEQERAMIEAGRPQDAKVAWHRRTGR